jgi:molybdopterin-guanine dinucleotide biosynthesis protein A
MLDLPTNAITAYVLAGGRSTRMGRDKAMLPLAGRTLLARAVATLRTVATEVVLLGDRVDRPDLQGADRAIPDLHPGCGPVGGMETALRDLAHHPTAEWACFLPVDMPFLPAGLYAALMAHWLAEAPFGVRVAYPTVDEGPQPLISLLHRSVLPYLTTAVEIGRLRVTSVLEGAAKELGSPFGDGLHSGHIQLNTDLFRSSPPHAREESAGLELPWRPSAQQLAARHLWFSNLNTPEEFDEGEAFLRSAPWE